MAAVGRSNPSSFFVGTQVPDSTSPPTHKRTYQACIPCRRRKVRCDLGPVDDPHEPPCVRCRRESKECFFSATRRKRKADGGEDVEGGDDEVEDDYAARNRRRSTLPATRSGGQGQAAGLQHGNSSAVSDSQSRTPPSQGYGPTSNGAALFPDSTGDAKDQEVTNETAAELFRTPIHNPGDALHLLFEAAGRSGDLNQDVSPIGHNLAPQGTTPQTATISSSGQHGTQPRFRSTTREHVVDVNGQTTNPSILQGVKHDPQDLRRALKAWSRLRFVRAGWFTAREAVSYIDYFYEHLAPMTPITPPDFRSPATHAKLLQEEPMLTVVLLTISSRYSALAGPGDRSRSFLVHERLWTYLQSMISRMFWGQEQFGGGFCGAGGLRKHSQATLTAPKDALKTGSLGSIGTIESLLLLTEWHPRAMHFPPGDDEAELLAPVEDSDPELESQSTRADSASNRTFTARGWTEPAWRSDRMCWSLLGTSLALAHEIGIFDYVNGQTFPSEDNLPWQDEGPNDRQRADRVRRLLYICATQTSGRLGLPNMFPSHADDSRVSAPSLQPDGLNATIDISEITQRCWAEITSLMQITNERLFPSKARTRELIRSGEYLNHLKDFQPLLRGWLDNFEVLELPKYSRLLLLVEYEYMRIYVNSLALQAVLEQWTSTHQAGSRPYAGATNGPNARTPSALLSPSLVELYKGNEYYIKEVVDASRNLLRNVVEGLLPNDGLKHTPVRTYFRIFSGAMFLLKTFALGAKEDEVAISLRLIDHTVTALRTSVVDDVHLCLRIADLVENLTSSIRTRFVRLCVQNPTDTQRANTPQKPSYDSEAAHGSRDVHFGNPGGDSRSTQQQQPDHFGYLFTNDPAQNPLAGISRNSIDLNDDSITIMPPPDLSYPNYHSYNSLVYNNNSNNNNNNNQHLYNPTGLSTNNNNNNHAGDYTPDWLALPLDPLLNGTGAQGSTGQGFGGFGPGMGSSFEMLDVLLNEHYSNEGGESVSGLGFT